MTQIYIVLGFVAFGIFLVIFMEKKAKKHGRIESEKDQAEEANEQNKKISAINNSFASSVDVKRLLKNRRK